RYESIGSETAGEFYSSELLIKINYSSSEYGDRPGRNVDTPMHEMGHLLGLNDLDTDTPSGTHKTLMGYNRTTTTSTIDNAITYHDIQGIAVLNGKHTTHSFNRYFERDGKYLHVCFYCDTIDSMSSIKSGSLQLEVANGCTHDYKQLVSLGNKHWVKCTKCYKVITHSHQYTSYSWIDLRQHKATCNCGASTLQGHAVSSKTYASGNKYATCLLCGGRAEIGFIQINTFNRNKQVALKNNYVLPNGVTVLFESDLEKYFCETLEIV
ncbi:MAG: hypothetical protein K2I88_02480, partial [Anaeroplasmataceae bacterium]|nr:hypothetical protein [Anaeroplasmataceae bacterium]